MTELPTREHNLDILISLLHPEDTSTGGGTAAALAGAMAAALVAMVASLSLKAKAGQESECARISEEAEYLSVQLLQGARDDAEAYGTVRLAYRLPKETETDQAMRRKAIEKALAGAARVPLTNMERCWRVLELGKQLEDHARASAASDLECAEYLSAAGLYGCAANVSVNVKSITDSDVAQELSAGAERWMRLAQAQGISHKPTS